MKKGLFRVLTVVIAFSMVITMFTISVTAAHKSPVTGDTCNNTGTNQYHGSMISSYGSGSHVLSNNGNCSTTLKVFNHTQKCSGCAYVFTTTYSMDCREGHSNSSCGYYAERKTSANCRD